MRYRPVMLMALLAMGAAPLGATPSLERPISIAVREVEVRQVVTHLLEDSGLSYVFADGVAGAVSAQLTDVPLRQALKVLLAAAGCEMTVKEDVLYIRRLPEPEKPAAEAALAPKDTPADTQPEGVTDTEADPMAAAPAEDDPATEAPVNTVYVMVPYNPQEGAMEPLVFGPAPQPQPQRPLFVPANPNLANALFWLRETGGGLSRFSGMPFGRGAGGNPVGLWGYLGR